MNDSARAATLLTALLTAALMAGCERSDGASASSGGRSPAATPQAALVSFPPDVQADDPEVNAFIRKAISVCMSKDKHGKPNYEAFRLLWSALEEPIGQQEFERGFAATQKVTILDVMKRRTPDDEIVYLVHCLVELDPKQVPQPTRDIVLLLRKETCEWRVATPPRKEVRALKAKYAREREEAAAASSNGVDSADAATS